jgi:hypothetical protein
MVRISVVRFPSRSAGNSIMKVPSCSLAAHTLKLSQKNTAINEICVVHAKPVVDDTELLGDSSSHAVSSSLVDDPPRRMPWAAVDHPGHDPRAATIMRQGLYSLTLTL